MSAVVIAFRPRTPRRIEVLRTGDTWLVRTDEGWRLVSETLARTLSRLADDITTEGGRS
jgi:hypothetical protein